jgi:cation diffusion facilitator CzcD-associated flavoprotein CzcO
MIERNRRVAVIGAGVSGVTTAAHLKAEGLDVTVFERAPVAGGVWLVDRLILEKHLINVNAQGLRSTHST